MGVHVLDATIRDGGYEIAHQFTEEDVALVVSALDAAGVSFIEVGYGMGVGAHKFPPSTRPKEFPVAGDLAHMRTARRAARRAKVGVLFGAGDIFCPDDYLDEVAACGMDFVRLAFMPADITPTNMRYLERARKLGMTASINCMQTYVMPPAEIAKLAVMCQSAGCEWWYVVDSAGGMQPGEVREYVRAVREATTMQIGLHAHNNLGLAVANSLAAVEEGATLVDGSLNGLGRATGNAPTEQLVLSLKNMGHERDVDLDPILRLSQMYRALLEGKGNDPMHFVSGASMLHSRNVPAVMAQAKERGLSEAEFLVRVGTEARKESCLARFAFPPEVFERAAAACNPVQNHTVSPALVAAVDERLSARSDPALARVCEDLAMRSARHHIPSVLHLVPAEQFPFSGPLPWQSETHVGVSVAAPGVLPAQYRPPSYVVRDPSIAAADAPSSRIGSFVCRWGDLWQDAIRAAVLALASTGRVAWVDNDEELREVAARLAAAGVSVANARPAAEHATLVARASTWQVWSRQLHRGDSVLFVDRSSAARRAADEVRAAGAHAIVPPIASTVASRVGELVAVASHLAAALSAPADAPFLPPLAAAGTQHAIADVVLGAIVEPGPMDRAEVTAAVAQARARLLVTGTGRP